MPTDTERLDWLQNECDGLFSCERLYNPFTDSPTFGVMDVWELFTVPSQHVQGNSVRDVIDKAMVKERIML